MRKIIFSLAIGLWTTSSFAVNWQTITDFTVIRTGGGSNQVSVMQAEGSRIVGIVRTCGFRTLSDDQQVKTQFILSGAAADAATAIFAGRATFAQIVAMKPPLPTGSWRSLKLNYTYKDFHENTVADSVNIPAPLVVIDGAVSNLMADIENQGFAALAKSGVCN